jgi:putative pyruvate formate lyase activating enzyme
LIVAQRAITEFVLDDFTPAYLEPAVRESMPARVSRALAELESCCACPRSCGINRLADETKFCNIGRHARVSSAFAHLGEEDCLRGWRGSGTIFFSSCNLQCVFCQNWDISQALAGEALNAEEIAALMLRLQASGCHNINFVTPEHVVPQLVEAIAVALDRTDSASCLRASVPSSLSVPLVYNTSAYDAVESLHLMEGLVDIYMPDFKFWSSDTSKRLAKAKDYPDAAKAAIREMHRQVGDLRFTPDGLACRGLLIRHLVMPGQLDESAAIFRWLAEEISPDTHINIMGQYRPEHEVGRRAPSGRRDAGSILFEEINRRPTREEMVEAYRLARDAGLWRFDERR